MTKTKLPTKQEVLDSLVFLFSSRDINVYEDDRDNIVLKYDIGEQYKLVGIPKCILKLDNIENIITKLKAWYDID